MSNMRMWCYPDLAGSQGVDPEPSSAHGHSPRLAHLLELALVHPRVAEPVLLLLLLLAEDLQLQEQLLLLEQAGVG